MRTRRVVGGRGVEVVLEVLLFTVLVLPFLPVSAVALAADDSVCARVQIEIQQELTLERQAFDAHMRIHNGLERVSLENVGVEVTFADGEGHTVRATSDPNDTAALFFIRLNSLDNIQDVDCLGAVAAATVADIHWLIIPAPGASNGVPAGTLYSVGAWKTPWMWTATRSLTLLSWIP